MRGAGGAGGAEDRGKEENGMLDTVVGDEATGEMEQESKEVVTEEGKVQLVAEKREDDKDTIIEMPRRSSHRGSVVNKSN